MTGEANLIHLFNVWYWLYKNMPPKISINSYIIDSNDFIAISNGQVHPLSKINNRTYQPWWEDIWDVNFYKNTSYGDGWESLCERINGLRKNK